LEKENVKKCFVFIVLAFLCWASAEAQTSARLRVATLDFGNSPIAHEAADRFATGLNSVSDLNLIDRDLSRVAARGSGYAGSLNLSLQEARDLGEAIGCDFYILGDAQTLRRTTSTTPIYFESYASIFLVSSRTGKLMIWARPSFSADNAADAQAKLFAELASQNFLRRFAETIAKASVEEKVQRELATDQVPVIEEAPDDDKAAAATGLRLPRPFRRLRPDYPDSAARADAEAVVDVLVDLDVSGEVSRIDVTRWAGFGLDEATINTVRKLHFFPAMRDGNPVPMRVLLRYNFRRPAP
jgi:TonB family protein